MYAAALGLAAVCTFNAAWDYWFHYWGLCIVQVLCVPVNLWSAYVYRSKGWPWRWLW